MKLSNEFLKSIGGLYEPADAHAIAAASKERGIKKRGYSPGHIAAIIKSGYSTKPSMIKLIVEYYEQKTTDFKKILNETA